jgi:hypothetical protein
MHVSYLTKICHPERTLTDPERAKPVERVSKGKSKDLRVLLSLLFINPSKISAANVRQGFSPDIEDPTQNPYGRGFSRDRPGGSMGLEPHEYRFLFIRL